jgi:hypothetical protein
VTAIFGADARLTRRGEIVVGALRTAGWCLVAFIVALGLALAYRQGQANACADLTASGDYAAADLRGCPIDTLEVSS